MRMPKIYFRPGRCDGCRACELACTEKHSQTRSIFLAGMEKPLPQPRIKVTESANQYAAVVCQHCLEAMCVGACMTGAMQYSDSGAVVHDARQCVGCWMCVMVCPFGAVVPLAEAKKAGKCNLCEDEKIPACVLACTRKALWYCTGEEYEMKVAGELACTT